jgi:hypothetical protein
MYVPVMAPNFLIVEVLQRIGKTVGGHKHEQFFRAAFLLS